MLSQCMVWDDVPGAQLDPAIVQSAGAPEMQFFGKCFFSEQCDRREAWEMAEKLIGVRWVLFLREHPGSALRS